MPAGLLVRDLLVILIGNRLWEQNLEPLWHGHTRTSTTLVGKRLVWVAILAACINAAFVFGTIFGAVGP
jgi:hypothetical protein